MIKSAVSRTAIPTAPTKIKTFDCANASFTHAFKEPETLLLSCALTFTAHSCLSHCAFCGQWYGKFAVDVFAVKNGLSVSDRRLAKEISAAALKGEKIGFACERQFFGSLPQELEAARFV